MRFQKQYYNRSVRYCAQNFHLELLYMHTPVPSSDEDRRKVRSGLKDVEKTGPE